MVLRRRTFYLCALLVAVLIAGGAAALRKLSAGMPDFRALENYTPSLTSRVYDSHGAVLAEFAIEQRELLTLSQIPVDLQNAVIATEDDQFFHHWGISPRGILRAAVRNLIHGRVVQGGSTLTQQLAKNIFLSPERNITRKLREVLLALQLERNFSKQEILQYYLNQIYFGHGASGAQTAAHVYFGKDVSKLDTAECALLAGLIRNPAGYSPFTHPAQARARRAVVLARMREEGYISPTEMQEALAEPIPLNRSNPIGGAAPYFVEHIRRRLEPKYGYNALYRGGLKIYTTLDLQMQTTAEMIMEKALSDFDATAHADWAKKLAEETVGGAEPISVSTAPPAPIQGAFVILDVHTGAIRAMIGGRGDTQWNRATQAHRQPGSTFKPFVWAAALQSGMTAATLVEDTPLAYYYDGRDWRLLQGATDQYAVTLATASFAQSKDFKVWMPVDFDGKFLGIITLRRALAQSRNVVSVRLIEHVGPPQVVALAHKAGIESHLDSVLALGLGASVVSPLEMANAFGTFADGGIHVDPYDVERVDDAGGKTLETHVPQENEAMSPQLAYLTTSLMKAVVEQGTGAYARRLRRPLAGKTGTTNDNRDLWFIGFTPDLVAAAWMGYDDPSSTLGRKDWTGGHTVVPWWTAIMEQVLKSYPPKDFPIPDGIVFAKIDEDTGMLALPTCPRTVRQAFLEGTEPSAYCNLDHTKPLNLSPAFMAASEMPEVSVGTSALVSPATGEAPTPLPTDEDLDKLSEPPDETNSIR